jgi:hypothetical protein
MSQINFSSRVITYYLYSLLQTARATLLLAKATAAEETANRAAERDRAVTRFHSMRR